MCYTCHAIMKPIFAAIFLVFSFVLASSPSTHAASVNADGRYFIPTTRSFWKNAIGARHVFEDGFTATLSDLQLKLVRLAGLRPIPVKKFNILAETIALSSPTPQAIPSQLVSWGIREMLDDPQAKETAGGSGVTVAVLDTGVDREHPDLARRIVGCVSFSDGAKPIVEDSCDDANGHGTHMAGIIAADGGVFGEGIYGFAPSASISAYRVCDGDGLCYSDDIGAAMMRAVDDGAQIIVLGFGGESESSFIDDALVYAMEHDVLVIAAAGNDGPYDDSLDWPARSERVVSVGALDNAQAPAEFSSRGLNDSTRAYQRNEGDVEFAAPGINIESTYRGGGYAILSGSSMAAPHVAGLAALVWQSDAKNSAEATRFLLREMAADINLKGDDSATGWGMPHILHR